ncbi:MAG: hypothetical protein KA234_07345 [Saprospiraceae bacterium]|nr:hypothetical protein [Saprospiraceae bacterium]
MENLVKNLDEIITKLHKLKEENRRLRSENKKMEVQLSNLKVEADQYKSQYLNITNQREDKAQIKFNSVVSQQDIKSDNSNTIMASNIDDIEIVKHQLDIFIEDIDQCIQIIQARNNATG